MFVHHPDQKHTGTERVGARTVAFTDGVAEVTVPSVVRHYRRAGFVVTDERGRDAAAPAGNASVEEWRAYARERATDPQHLEDIEQMGRDELRKVYGAPVTDPVVVDALDD